MKLDAASFLLQWATGGLLFAWVTTRRRQVGLGYGWLLRILYGSLALGSLALLLVRDERGSAWTIAVIGAAGCVLGAATALSVSVVRRRAGVSGQRSDVQRRQARVAAMRGAELGGAAEEDPGPEFPPTLDLIAPALGLVGVLGFADLVGGDMWLAAARLVTGALLLGAVSDAMLLGHWYLVQPGLGRAPLNELVVATAAVWPVHVVVQLVSPGMVDVLSGSIDDGYGGLLGWVWLACAISTIVLVGVTWAALRERYYSAVMSATGLLYLAILTAFGQDLIARAVLAP